jgi:hypothetical protein
MHARARPERRVRSARTFVIVCGRSNQGSLIVPCLGSEILPVVLRNVTVLASEYSRAPDGWPQSRPGPVDSTFHFLPKNLEMRITAPGRAQSWAGRTAPWGLFSRP